MRARLRLVTFAVPVPIFISLRLAGIIIGRIRDVTCSDFCFYKVPGGSLEDASVPAPPPMPCRRTCDSDTAG
ncbi:MAG: hypothetical protein OD814_000048 [Candidatus Alkanophagales archaeon MCA70_species_1]|nr:hypothetical protein [Candidatus Alkanophaga volatiphilum]